MARLTRTQKYAGLRQSLSNDKETSLSTKDLLNYEDRLSNITGNYNLPDDRTSAYSAQQTSTAEVPQQDDGKYSWTDFVETPIEDIVKTFNDTESNKASAELNNSSYIWNSIQEAPVKNEAENDYAYTLDQANAQLMNDKPEATEQRTPVIDQAYLEAERRAREEREARYQQKESILDVDDSLENELYANQKEEPALINTPIISESHIGLDFNKKEEAPVYETPASVAPETQPVETFRETYKPVVEQAPVENVAPVNPAPAYEAPRQFEAPRSEQYYEEPVKETIVEPIEEVYEEPVVKTPVVEETPAPVVQEVEQPRSDTLVRRKEADDPALEQNIFEEISTDEVTETPVETKPESEEVKEYQKNTYEENPFIKYASLESNELRSDTTNSSFVSSTLNEVSAYNHLNGEETIGTLANNMVNEIRHHDDPKKNDNDFIEVPVSIDDEEDEDFSNTVSMEINKIMDEVSIAETKTPEVKTKAKHVKEAPVEHPVLAKKLEQEEEKEVVEIKNLKELEAEPQKDTISNTIPFVVTADEDEETIEDSDDEEGSNTILNIILIVLIIVLVAVLGLIIFYILKTKGII